MESIALDSQLIGFTMCGITDEFVTHSRAHKICRFMIDEEHQGKGYGKRALQIIVNEMLKTYDCDEIFLSTAPNNDRGKHVYETVGFRATGEFVTEEDGFREDIFCLKRASAQ